MNKLKPHTVGWCLLCWLHPAASLFAQPPDLRFEHISVEQGLSNYALRRIVQDQQGFLWFSTEDGLNKYDGYEFTIYKPDPADSSSLPSRDVQTLYADRAGNLWVGAGGDGLHRYNPDTDKFERFKYDPYSPESLAGKFVTAILEDGKGELWMGTTLGLYRYHRQRDHFIIYRHDPHDTTSISSDHVTALCEDQRGNLWIGTFGGGINRHDRSKNVFLRYRHDPRNPSGLSSAFITCLREASASQDVVWIGTTNGLNRYNRQTNTIVRCRYDAKDPHTIAPDWIFDLYVDSKGTLWVGTFHIGLWRYDAATDRFFSYRHNPDDPYSLSEDRISCIYEDRSGVMWMGTYRHGLNRYNRRQDAFTRYQAPRGREASAVRLDRNGELWIGTDSDGLLRYNRQGKRVAHYRHDPTNPAGLSTYGILAIYEDGRGELWIGTGRGLNRYDAKRQRFVRYHHEPINPAIGEHYEVKAIYEDADGELWIGTKGSGLCRLDREKKTFTYYRHDPKNPQSISYDNVWAITADKNGDLWIGTFGGGLNRFDRKTATFTRYQPEAIYSVYADQNGYIWAGTFGGGLLRLDPNTGRTILYTDRDGLPDNFVKAILPDSPDFPLKTLKEDRGNLWLSTDKGLSKFNPKNGTFKNYTVKDGLISNQFLSGAYYKSPDGRLFFGGEGGVIAFYPDSVKDNQHLPPVAITSFKVFDKPLPLQRALFALEEIKLSYRQNFFSFEFVALDYTEPAKNQYAYKLGGFDPDWIHAGARRYASYTNVDPGEYVFRVKGANSDGVWNENGAAINITITPPFWKTWWFRTSAFATLSLLAWGAYRYRVNHLLAMERLRTRLAADLHDEIAGNLSSIAMFGKIIQDEKTSPGENPPAKSQLLERIIALSQESVVSIREIIWAIDPKPETIHDLLLRVHDLAVNACRAQNMMLKFDAPPQEQLPPKNLSPEQRKHLWLLLKEAVNNAAKHSGGTELAIYASFKMGHLNVSIIDNGTGLDGAGSSTRFSGKGLGTMKARAEQLNGAFGMLSDESGTTVNVTIKI